MLIFSKPSFFSISPFFNAHSISSEEKTFSFSFKQIKINPRKNKEISKRMIYIRNELYKLKKKKEKYTNRKIERKWLRSKYASFQNVSKLKQQINIRWKINILNSYFAFCIFRDNMIYSYKDQCTLLFFSSFKITYSL